MAAPLPGQWSEPCATQVETVQSSGPGLALLCPPAHGAAALSAAAMLALQTKLADLWRLHDFSGSLAVAERILAVSPGYAPALKARHACRVQLTQMHAARLGDLDRVPQRLVRPEDVPWLGLDPVTAFVLSHVDGQQSYAQIRDVCGLDTLESLRTLSKLVVDQVIGPAVKS